MAKKKFSSGELNGHTQVINLTFGYLEKKGFSFVEQTEYGVYILDSLAELLTSKE